MQNLNRNVFALNGASGMLIATVLLLAIVAALTALGIDAQRSVAQKPYKLENAASVQMKSTDNAKHIVVKE